ncbi:MAG: exodeoxyribonuclease VII large subunit [Calditrichaeota bacterium]|nr:MAG: exodeoxyribonuclease VII large subunit [Calditrichota bacterium]
MQNQPKAYTVTAITKMIKGQLEESFNNIWVEGEVTGYLHHGSGHRYLTLKDENAVIKLTIWRSVGAKLKFEPENGQKILAYGDINVYEKGGSYQLNVRKIVPVGVGELELAFRQLYEKLSGEGLFDPSHKKEIPPFAQKIGVVTSPTGAAIRDIIQISRRRNKSVELIIYPAKVQGDGGELTIAKGIDYFNSRDDIDIIITGRGGGSLEDLWNFNTEEVVRSIFNSRIPVISAVGHEIDTTLADYVSDLRAPTPSAGAELAVWSKKDFESQLKGFVYQQTVSLKNMVENARDYLSSLLERPVFAKPMDMVRQRQQHLDSLTRMLTSSGKNSFIGHKNRLSLLVARLDSLSPLKVLARGYSVSRSQSGDLVNKIDDIAVGDEMETILTDGRLISKIEKKLKNN